MARTKHTGRHVPPRALPEGQEPNPRATVSALDKPEHPADAPYSVWRSCLIDYFSLLDEWSKKARRKRAVLTLSPPQAAFCRTSQPAALCWRRAAAFHQLGTRRGR
jgi:hypothetical protein